MIFGPSDLERARELREKAQNDPEAAVGDRAELITLLDDHNLRGDRVVTETLEALSWISSVDPEEASHANYIAARKLRQSDYDDYRLQAAITNLYANQIQAELDVNIATKTLANYLRKERHAAGIQPAVAAQRNACRALAYLAADTPHIRQYADDFEWLLVNSNDEDSRRWALMALAEAGISGLDGQTIDAVLNMWRDGDGRAKFQALRLMVSLEKRRPGTLASETDQLVPMVYDILDEPERYPEERDLLLEAIHELAENDPAEVKGVADRLIDYLDADDEVPAESEVVSILATLGEEFPGVIEACQRIAPRLVSRVESTDDPGTAKLLAMLASSIPQVVEESLPTFERMLLSEDPDIVWSTVTALWELASEQPETATRVVSTLKGELHPPPMPSKMALIEGLQRLAGDHPETVVPVVSDLKGLLETESSWSTASVRYAGRTKTANIKTFATGCLAAVAETDPDAIQSAVPALTALLAGSDDDTTVYACRALGLAGAESARDALENLRDHRTYSVRVAAEEAIRHVGPGSSEGPELEISYYGEGDIIAGEQHKTVQHTERTEIDQSTTVEDSVVNRSDIGAETETGRTIDESASKGASADDQAADASASGGKSVPNFCPNCGEDVSGFSEASFCPHCGSEF